MDKATSESKIFLGYHDECGQDASVLCHHNILSGSIVAYKLKVNRPIYEILQILSFSLLDKTHVKEILTDCDYKMSKN